MRRALLLGALLFQSILLVALGVALAGPIRDILDHRATGPNLACAGAHRLCIGQSIDASDLRGLEADLGGLADITCGFDPPGDTGGKTSIPVGDLLAKGCGTDRYVLTFSDGRRMTSLWIDHGRIARINRSPRHVIDP